MEYLETNIEQIRLWVKENYTHRMISDTLKQNFPEVTRGFSEKSIYDYFARNAKSIKKVIWKLIVLSKIRYAKYVLKWTFIICVEKLHTVYSTISGFI